MPNWNDRSMGGWTPKNILITGLIMAVVIAGAVIGASCCGDVEAATNDDRYEMLASYPMSSLSIAQLQWMADYCVAEMNEWTRWEARSCYADEALIYQNQILILMGEPEE